LEETAKENADRTERCMYVSAGKAGREKKIYGRQKKKIYIKCVVVWYTMK